MMNRILHLIYLLLLMCASKGIKKVCNALDSVICMCMLQFSFTGTNRESYGVDIVDTETEKSDGVGDEDEYEDSFIDDDDDDLQVIPQSPFSDSDEDTLLRDRKKGAKVKHRRLRKKYQSPLSDDQDTMDSECEDMATISSLLESAENTKKPGAQGKAEKDGGLKRKPHEDNVLPLVEKDPKQEKKMKKPKEEKVVKSKDDDDFFAGEILLWDKSLKNQMKFDQSSQNTALTNGGGKKSEIDKGENALHTSLPSDDLIKGGVVKTGDRTSKTHDLGDDEPFNNANTENQTQPDEARCLKLAYSLLKSDEDEKQANVEGEKAKTRKRKQKPAKEKNALGADLSLENISREDQAHPDEAGCESIKQGNMSKSEDNQKQANDEGENTLNAPLPSDDLIHGIVANTGEEKNNQANMTKVLVADKPFNNVNSENQSQSDEVRSVKLAHDSLLKSDEDKKQANDEGKKAKTRKRKQKPAKEGNALGADLSLSNISREDQAQPDEAKCKNIEQGSLLKSEDNQKQANDEGVKLLQSDELVVHEKVTKLVKRKKKIAKVEKAVEIDNSSGNINRADQAQRNDASSENNENIVEDTVLKNEENSTQSNKGNTAVVLGPETVPEPKKKRKKAGKDKALEVEANNGELVIEDEANGDEHTISVDADLPGNENHNVEKIRKKTALNNNTTVLDNNGNGESKKVLRSRK